MNRRSWITSVALPWLCLVTVTGWIDPIYQLNEEGIRLYERDKFNEAAERFSSILRLARTPAVAHYNLGESHYRLGEYDLAIREYFRAARSKDRDLRAKAYFNLGNCQYYRGELEKALHYFRKAIKLDPDDEDARVNYEFILNKLNAGDPPDKDTENAERTQEIEETIAADNSHDVFIDERARNVIYDMLEAEERSNRKKVRFRDDLSGDRKGKNW
jgi:tetratricopeptide (TPR) repeat protein